MNEDAVELILKMRDGEEYRMSVDRARELRDKLNNTLGGEPVAIPYPLYRDGFPNPLMPPYEVTCSQ